MNTFYQILGLLGAGLILFIIYNAIKNKPEQFQKESLNKSFFTMGVLAIVLMVFIALLVLILKK